MLPALFAGAKAGDPSQAADRNQPNDRRYRRRKAFNKPVKVKGACPAALNRQLITD